MTPTENERATGTVTTIMATETLRVTAYDLDNYPDSLWFDDPTTSDSALGMRNACNLREWR